MQMTYRDAAITRGTGETDQDGLRIGIDNDAFNFNGTTYLNGYLRWQENTPFVVQTDWDNTAGGTEQGERLRITSTGAPGVPATIDNYLNTTRVAISYLGSFPINAPSALLHLGTNTSLNVSKLMDFGTLTSSGGVNFFSGIAPASYLKAPNANVLGFGGNDFAVINVTGSTLTNNAPDVVSMRMSSTNNNLGIGNFGPLGTITTAPSERLDVEGNARFRNVPAAAGQSLVLGVQQGTNANDVKLSRLAFSGSATQVLLGNGTWGTLPSTSAFGALCSNNTAGAGAITADTKVDLNDRNLYFIKNNTLGNNHVGIGYACGTTLAGKLSVWQTHPAALPVGTIGIDVRNNDIANQAAKITYYGVKAKVDGLQTFANKTHVGGFFEAGNAGLNIGVQCKITPNAVTNETNYGVLSQAMDDNSNSNIGGSFYGQGGSNMNTGVIGSSYPTLAAGTTSNMGYGGQFLTTNHILQNVAVYGEAGSQTPNSNNSLSSCFGVYGIAYNGGKNYGVYGEAKGPNSIAGYFAGTVVASQPPISISDEKFKANVHGIDDALAIVKQLKPAIYTMRTDEYPQFHFENEKQFGFIAQEVENVLPNIVKPVTHPAEYDSLGNVIREAVDYKGINYTAIIPINTQAIKELNATVERDKQTIDSLKNVIANVNSRLTQLESCLAAAFPNLCNMGNTMIQQTQPAIQQYMQQAVNVHLSDKSSIVLNQNVPNPFAESTIITYSIPAQIVKAQIHFYDGTGKLINTVEVKERGQGQLNVFASDLSSGVYTYSLVADGQVVSTKRMVKE